MYLPTVTSCSYMPIIERTGPRDGRIRDTVTAGRGTKDIRPEGRAGTVYAFEIMEKDGKLREKPGYNPLD